MTSTAQLARIATALDLTDEALRADVVRTMQTVGATVAEWGTYPSATRDELAIGDLVAVYAHQRIRIAKVWALTPTKLSAVYVTPSEVERVARHSWAKVCPNSITAKIADVELVARQAPAAPAAPAGTPAPQAAEVATADVERAGMLPMDVEGFLF